MRKYISLFFSVTFFLFSCEGNHTPKGVLGHDRMISVLTQVYITDGGLYTVPQIPDSMYKYGMYRYLTMFKKNHTDSAQFNKSLRYYATQPEELQKIYDKVLANLMGKTDSLTKMQLKKNSKSRTKNALPPK